MFDHRCIRKDLTAARRTKIGNVQIRGSGGSLARTQLRKDRNQHRDIDHRREYAAVHTAADALWCRFRTRETDPTKSGPALDERYAEQLLQRLTFEVATIRIEFGICRHGEREPGDVRAMVTVTDRWLSHCRSRQRNGYNQYAIVLEKNSVRRL